MVLYDIGAAASDVTCWELPGDDIRLVRFDAEPGGRAAENADGSGLTFASFRDAKKAALDSVDAAIGSMELGISALRKKRTEIRSMKKPDVPRIRHDPWL